MKERKILVLFLAGMFLIAFGFYLGKSSIISYPKYPKETLDESVFSDNTSKVVRQSVFITKVLDGDTIQTNKGEQIRYIGINAPEKNEPFFEKAKEFNESLVLDRNVDLEFDIERIDRYGRYLTYVFVDNKFVNLEMVRSGLAVTQTVQPNVKYQDVIIDVQKEAREKCLGIWSGLCQDEEFSLNSQSRCVKIAFVNFDAEGNDNQNKNGEWIEIKSFCNEPVSLNGWILKDTSASNRYQFEDFTLEADKSVVIYSGCGQDSEDKLYWKCPEGKYAVWNNTGDHAFLYNEKGELVSSLDI